jgi:hypothetical protein
MQRDGGWTGSHPRALRNSIWAPAPWNFIAPEADYMAKRTFAPIKPAFAKEKPGDSLPFLPLRLIERPPSQLRRQLIDSISCVFYSTFLAISLTSPKNKKRLNKTVRKGIFKVTRHKVHAHIVQDYLAAEVQLFNR